MEISYLNLFKWGNPAQKRVRNSPFSTGNEGGLFMTKKYKFDVGLILKP